MSRRGWKRICLPSSALSLKGAALGRLLSATNSLVVSSISKGVFHVAGGIVCRSLGLIHFAFGLQFFVASDLAGRVFDSALGLVGGALHVFAIHVPSPSCVGST